MIINADDFGYSSSVNRAIVDCFNKKLINRTTIMVNMPNCEEAAKLALENGFMDSVGLHINLTEGKPLTQECASSSLCDKNGNFTGKFHIPFSARLYLPKNVRSAIHAEVEAQMQKFIDMGFTLRHADSHNYTHSYISVYVSIKDLFEKYGFVSTRISRNVSEDKFSLLFKIYKSLYNTLLRRLTVNGKRILTTEYFCSVQDFNASPNKDLIKHDIEFMTHPNYDGDILTDNTLPKPHPFVTTEWIRENELHLEDVSGKKIKLFVAFIHAHIGGAMTSLVNFLNALDTNKYDVDVMFHENDEHCRYGIKDDIHIMPQGKIYKSFSVVNMVKKLTSPSYLMARVQDFYYKFIRHNRRKGIQIMSKQGYKYSRKVTKEYDVAIAYEFNWCMHLVINKVNAKKKMIWHHVEYGKSGMEYSIDKTSMELADALVFVSDDCRKTFVEKHPELSGKCVFMPNILSSEYVKAKSNFDVELPFDNGDDYFKILTVARISFEHKGLDRAVNVFSRLKKDGLLTNVKWVIIGEGRDMPELLQMIKNEGLEDVIYPIGLCENPVPFYKKFDLFFLPSRHEGKPMVVTEAFIMGMVPAVTAYTSAYEQIRDGVDGMVFENNDDALYQGMKNLLQRPQIITEFKQTVLNTDYGNEKEIKVFDNLVDNLLNRR